MKKDFKHLTTDLKKAFNELQQFMDTDFPDIIGIEAVNHYQESFVKEGFDDKGIDKWKPRDVEANPAKYSKRARAQSAGRAILTGLGGGELHKSVGYKPGNRRVVVFSDKVYAQVHNEGGKAGRGAGFIMPKRKFIGASVNLDRKIEKKVRRSLDKIFYR